MSKQLKKKHGGQMETPSGLLDASGQMLMAGRDAYGDLITGSHCLNRQGLKDTQPALFDYVAYDDKALEEKVPAAVENRMLSIMAIILCRAYERCYSRIPVVTQHNVDDAQKWVEARKKELGGNQGRN